MSIQAVAWVLESSRSRGVDRLVLISLANHANHDGECWPAQRTIAREAGIASGTVSNAIGRLVGLGELEIVENGGARRSARYRLCSGGERSVHVGVSAASTPGPRRTVMNRQEPSSAQQMSKECEKCHGVGWVPGPRAKESVRCDCNRERRLKAIR